MNIILFDEKPSFIPAGDERARHITSVLHLKAGDVFKAGVINGKSLTCTIDCITSEGIKISAAEEEDLSALYPLTLMLALVRPISMRRILREAVSLGVGRIMLLRSDLGEKSYMDAGIYKSGEYRKILIDGAMQSGFTGVPETLFFSSLDEAIGADDNKTRVLLDNKIGTERLSRMSLKGPVTIAIGPERGWSERERTLMLESAFIPSLIGERILRTETASSVAIALALGAMDIL